jgi:hypothetical protein
MEVEVKVTKGKSLSDLCPAERQVVSDIQLHLENLQLDKNSSDPASKQIKDATLEIFQNSAWRHPFLFDTSVSDVFPKTNYQIDAVMDLPHETCHHKHRFLVEHCFDNRQAIGTNLLKFELASSIFEQNLNASALPILICADKPSLKSFGWDGSIASSEEYENAIRSAYSQIIKVAPVLVVIRN